MEGDGSYWSRRVTSLEGEVQSVKAELASVRGVEEEVRRELRDAEVALKSVLEENDRLGVDVEELKGKMGKGVEVARLEGELHAGQMGFVQARFERDSLEAELMQLKRALKNAAKRPLPGRIERVPSRRDMSSWSSSRGDRLETEQEEMGQKMGQQEKEGAKEEKEEEEEEKPVRVEAAVKVGNRFYSGACFVYGDRLKFEPDFVGTELHPDAQFEVEWGRSSSSLGLVKDKIEELDDAEMPAAEGVMMRMVIQRGHGGDGSTTNATPSSEPLEFVGFQDAIEAIHARLVAELLHKKPLIAPQRDRNEPSVSRTLPSRRRIVTASPGAPVPLPPSSSSAMLSSHSPSPSSSSVPSVLSTTKRKPTAYTPRLSESSQLVTTEQMLSVYDTVPLRYRSSDLELVYSTMRDGISLQTFYHKCGKIAPTVVLMRDSRDHVFGCFAPSAWRNEQTYYSTGESYVFSVVPRLEVFHWTRTNSYFQLSNDDFLAMGGGGHFALWLDADFLHGSSNECETFDNPPLASSKEFTCVSFEAWAFKTFRRI